MSRIFAGLFFAGVQPTLHAIRIIASLHGERIGSRLVRLVVLVVTGDRGSSAGAARAAGGCSADGG